MDLRRLIPALGVACVITAVCPAPAAAGPVTRFAERQLARTHAELPRGAFPNHTRRSGRWQVTGPQAWTSGFLSSALWLVYERTKDPVWRRRAAARQAPLKGQRLNTATHDVGFIMHPFYGPGWRLTKRPAYRRVALAGAASLASRFNGAVGATRSWGAREGGELTVVIDNMMNIDLLFWAARLGGPRAWRKMAHRHALTTLRDHVRPDGSTYHVVDYDVASGRVLRKRTHQGAATESTWSRGQAWAIHGFASAYRHTRDPRLLTAARRVATWWLRHVPPDMVPAWDFGAPPFGNPGLALGARDSSAAAVAASGLLDLARLEPRRREARNFRRVAVATLRSLASRRYRARRPSTRSILVHGTAHYTRPLFDTGLIYGDYYFLQALTRADLDL